MKKHCCPFTGVYLPRFIPSVLAGFAFLFGYNYVVHHKLLAALYEQTPNLWRPESEMEAYCTVMLIFFALIAFITALIYSRNHEGKGVGEGIRFGSMLGVLLGVTMAASYVWMPISWELAQSWFFAGFFEGLGLGLIFSCIYCCSKKSCCDTKKECCDTKKECCDKGK